MDAQEAIKKYWPWALGGVVGLFLLSRMGGSSSGGGDYAAYVAAQSAAAQSNAQAGIAQSQIASQTALANRQLDLAEKDLMSQAQTNYLLAQGAMAKGVGEAASGVVGALLTPYTTVLQTSAYENSAALLAASNIAIGGFETQRGLVAESSKAIAAVSEGLKGMATVNVPAPRPGPFESLLNSRAVGNITSGIAGSMANFGTLPTMYY